MTMATSVFARQVCLACVVGVDGARTHMPWQPAAVLAGEATPVHVVVPGDKGRLYKRKNDLLLRGGARRRKFRLYETQSV